MNSLSQHQIAQIKKIISDHDIRYIDVQIEMIDFIASSVEEKMDKQIPFDVALENTMAQLPVKDIDNWEKSKVKNLSSQYKKNVYNIFFDYFKVPKNLWVVVGLNIIIYHLIHSLDGSLAVLVVVLIALMGYYIYEGTYENTKNGYSPNNLLALKTIQELKSGVLLSNLVLFSMFFIQFSADSMFFQNWFHVITSMIITLFFNLFYIVYFKVDPYLNDEIEHQFKTFTP